MAFAVRTVGDPTALAGDLAPRGCRGGCGSADRILSTLEQLVDERAGGFTFIARALGVVGAIALVLSVMGIYSLMAFLTTQRTQEIGVRMALGAGRWQVVRATTRRAIVITAAGSLLARVARLRSRPRHAVDPVRPGHDQPAAAGRSHTRCSPLPRCWPHICRRAAPRGSIRWQRCGNHRHPALQALGTSGT